MGVLDARFSLRLIRPKPCGGFASMTVGRRPVLFANLSSRTLGYLQIAVVFALAISSSLYR